MLVLLPFCVQYLIASSNFIQPFTEVSNLVQLFGRDLLRQAVFHTSPELMMQLVIREVSNSAMKKGVLRLDHNGVVPEAARALGHREQFTEGIFFPVLGEVIGTKFYHKSGERQGDDMLMIRTNPISNVVIHEPADDQRYLVIWDNLLMNEKVHTGMLELTHHSGGDISGC